MEELPPYETSEESVRRIGKPVAAFKPGLDNVVAGVIIGLLMAIGGGAFLTYALWTAIVKGPNLPWWADKGEGLGAIVFGAVFGMVIAGLGIALIVGIRSLNTLRVLVGSEGFVCINRKEHQLFLWSQVQKVRETVSREYFPLDGIAKYAVPMGKSRSFMVWRRDGVLVGFDGDTVKKVVKLARLIEEGTRPYGIPWELVKE
jgi:hypothetical protein